MIFPFKVKHNKMMAFNHRSPALAVYSAVNIPIQCNIYSQIFNKTRILIFTDFLEPAAADPLKTLKRPPQKSDEGITLPILCKYSADKAAVRFSINYNKRHSCE
ncbi:hypothetical protein D7V32_05335 [Acinetobacter tianfuensis]|uniref:Uncharacterized protein n=1 Tax=Acinetobacter tianfuensis TaxID=2419603 RepID=A0A3A8EGI9_9GAMM|nr:hypothetical protein D7V32_05335 [Acinetobacter tianfuensis]